MKIKHFTILAAITAVFAAFTVGYFLGSNFGRPPLSIVPAPTTDGAETQPLSFFQIPGRDASPLININTATAEQLQTLPGIGPSISQRIIDYRLRHGSFSSVGELAQVEGIGMHKLQLIIDRITVGG